MTKSKRITYLAIFSALVIVLQSFTSFIGVNGIWKVAPTFALIPIVLGGVVLGVWQGAFLGFVFSTVVLIFGLTGYDLFTNGMIQYNPILAVLLIYAKGCCAGFVSALVYRLMKNKFPKLSVWFSSALCPLVNTGLFCVGAFFFKNYLTQIFAGDIINIIFITLVGVNFLVEFPLNLVLTPAIVRVSSIFDKTLKIGE